MTLDDFIDELPPAESDAIEDAEDDMIEAHAGEWAPEDAEIDPDDIDAYDYERRTVSPSKVFRSEKNPRTYAPTDTLIEDVSRKGVIDPPIVTYDEARDRYEAFDGWQRTQAAKAAGVDEIPVMVFETDAEATDATASRDMATELSKFHEIKNTVIGYQDRREAGMGHMEAVHATAEAHSRTPRTVRSYVKIYTLPPRIRELLKDPNDRDPSIATSFERYRGGSSGSMAKRARMRLGLAEDLAEVQDMFGDQTLEALAANVMGRDMSADTARAIIDRAIEVEQSDEEMSILDVVNEVRYGTPSLGHVRLDTDFEIDGEAHQAIHDRLTSIDSNATDFTRSLWESAGQKILAEQSDGHLFVEADLQGETADVLCDHAIEHQLDPEDLVLEIIERAVESGDLPTDL